MVTSIRSVVSLSLFLRYAECSSQYLDGFIELGAKFFRDATTKALKLTALEIILCCVYYNATATLAILVQKQWVHVLFDSLFKNVLLFKRVFDKKLCILTAMTIAGLPVEAIPAEATRYLPALFQLVFTMFEGLPKAYQDRKAMEECSDDGDDSDYYSDDYTEDEEEFEEEAAQVSNGVQKSTAGKEASSDASEDGDDGDYEDYDEIQEDPMSETPIDALDEYAIFGEFVTGLRQPSFKTLYKCVLTVSILGLRSTNSPMYEVLEKAVPNLSQYVEHVMKAAEARSKVQT